MALKHIRLISTLCLLISILSFCLPTGYAQALSNPQSDDLPSLQSFAKQIETGEPDELVGVYVPEVFAARVTGQPNGDARFVTSWPNYVTQFSAASRFGSTGLLAHNTLAGQNFSKLTENQTFHLIYGDGRTSTFVVTDILRYQALEPNSVTSTFKDLDNGESLTASELFQKVYIRPGMVIFQTCIAANGNSSWGRLFIIAEPISE